MKRTSIKKRPLSDTVIANLEPELKEYSEKGKKISVFSAFFEYFWEKLSKMVRLVIYGFY